MSQYAWDPEKARVNLAKHGVSFEEAEGAIEHALAIAEPDLLHSPGMGRIRITALSPSGRLLVVIVSTEAPRPRIISARRATKRERHAFEARP